jgi:hypothetical protein
VRDRRSQLDPESYVFELSLAERERLDVFVEFRRFVDALLVDLRTAPAHRGGLHRDHRPPGAAVPSPLLVLPIDDADMNPHFSTRLLELFRSLYHPRLFFLVSGESRLFRATIETRVLGELLAPLRGVPPGLPESHVPQAALEVARTLPIAIYDKVIPPRRRFALPSMSAIECLLRLSMSDIGPLLPIAADPEATAWWRNVRSVLDIPVEKGNNPRPRRLLIPDRTDGVPTLGDYLAVGPETAGALPDTMRGLGHFEQRVITRIRAEVKGGSRIEGARPGLPNLVKNGAGDLSRHVVVDLWKEAVDQAPDILDGFSETDRQRFSDWRSWVRIDPGSGCLDVSHGHLVVDYSGQRVVFGNSVTLCDEGLLGLRLGRRLLPPRLNSVLLLAGWLAYDGPEDIYRAPVSGPDEATSRLLYVCVEHNTPPPAEYHLKIGWPVPRWRVFDILMFTKGWGLLLPSFRARPLSLASVLRYFLELVLSIAMERDPHVSIEATSPQPTAIDYADLARRIVDLAKPRAGTRAEYQRSWALGSAGLLAAPESGLAPAEANDWLTALKMAAGEQWTSMRSELRQARQARLERAIASARQETGLPPRHGDEQEMTRREAEVLVWHFDEERAFLWGAEVERPLVPVASGRRPGARPRRRTRSL